MQQRRSDAFPLEQAFVGDKFRSSFAALSCVPNVLSVYRIVLLRVGVWFRVNKIHKFSLLCTFRSGPHSRV